MEIQVEERKTLSAIKVKHTTDTDENLLKYFIEILFILNCFDMNIDMLPICRATFTLFTIERFSNNLCNFFVWPLM